jgi:hypothetical protein
MWATKTCTPLPEETAHVFGTGTIWDSRAAQTTMRAKPEPSTSTSKHSTLEAAPMRIP